MGNIQQKLLLFILISICTAITSQWVLGQTSATPTPDTREIYTYFPDDLVCEEAYVDDGPSIGLVTIGKTTLGEMIDLYSGYLHVQMYYDEPDGEILVLFKHFSDGSIYMRINVCVTDNIIVAAKGNFPTIAQIQQAQRQTEVPQPPVIPVSFEYWGIKHFIARYGIPDVVTYSPEPTRRVAFWFEQGVAGEFYIVDDPSSQTPSSFGALTQVIYFPFQDKEGYEDRWPFNQTYPEERYIVHAAPFVATDVSTERNPFDFEAIGATLTAQPWPMPTPTATRAP